jgi:hypothetical protein
LDLPRKLAESNARILARLKAGHYDFLDLGTNQGGGFKIAEKVGGTKGVGFDLSPNIVNWNLERQRDVMLHDVRALPPGITGIKFAVCSHVLEHLPSIYDVGSVIAALVPLCGDFLLLCGPNFDSEEYLAKQNLKLVHTAMRDHLCHFKTIDLVNVLVNLDLRDFVIGLSGPINDSSNQWVHRADAPAEGIWAWEEGKSLPKPAITFSKPLHRDFVCIVKLSARANYEELLKNYAWGCNKVIFRSNDRF